MVLGEMVSYLPDYLRSRLQRKTIYKIASLKAYMVYISSRGPSRHRTIWPMSMARPVTAPRPPWVTVTVVFKSPWPFTSIDPSKNCLVLP